MQLQLVIASNTCNALLMNNCMITTHVNKVINIIGQRIQQAARISCGLNQSDLA